MGKTADQQQLVALASKALEHSRCGEFDQARATCHAIFDIDPGNISALQTYVGCTKIVVDDPVLDRLRGAVHAKLPDALQSQVQFMLGKSLDDIGDVDAAFAAFRSANALADRSYDRDAMGRLATAMLQATRDLPPISLTAKGPRIVFVIGMPRSGTSLMAQSLGSHAQITNLGEQTALGDAIAEAQGGGVKPVKLARRPDARTLHKIRNGYLDRTGRTDGVLVDKMPENYWWAWLIPMVFPNAVIVNMRRDRIANCWSCYRHDFRVGHNYSYDFINMLAHYAMYEALMKHWGKRMMEVQLENFTAAPKPQIMSILDQLTLPWDDACLRPEALNNSVTTLSIWQVRQGITKDISARWQRYLPLIQQTWLNPAAR